MEETSFVPSAIGFWQFASVVIDEGEEAFTTNVFQQCYNESPVAKGEKQLTRWQWYKLVEKKTHLGGLWKMTGKETVHTRDVRIISP